MALTLASADAFPYVCSVFRCDACEQTEVKQGRLSAVPPAGWLAQPRDDGVTHLCPHCVPSATS